MSFPKHNQRRTGWLLATLAALSSAAFIVPYKAATDRGGFAGLVLVLLSSAALFNTLASSRALARGEVFNRPAFLAAGIMSLFTVGGNLASTMSLRLLHPAITSSLLQTQVLYVALAAHFLLKESISWRWLGGALCALLGIIVMRSPQVGMPTMTLAGAFFANVAALCFGMMHVITRKMIARIHPLSVNALRLWIAALLTALWPQSRAELLQLPAVSIGLTVLAAFFGPFFGRACLMYSARYIPASQAILISLGTPFVALLLAAYFLGMWPRPVELFGGGLVLLGIVWPLSEGLRQTAPEPDSTLL